MNIKEQRAAALAKATNLVNAAKGAGRGLDDHEKSEYDELIAEIKGYDAQIQKAAESDSLLSQLGELGKSAPEGDARDQGRKSGDDDPKDLGRWFVKHAGERLVQSKGISGATVSAPEFKAATDTQTVGSVFGGVLTQIDRTIIQGVRPRLVVSDLLGSGTLAGNAISYFVEGALEGAFATVAEGGQKPQLHHVDPTLVTDALKKIAGFTKFSDEMLEDLDFVVSEINIRLLYELARFEEQQLLNGNGTGTNVLGLLNRSGLQTEARGTAASGDTVADTLFRALTKVETGGGLTADGIIMHPLDYQNLRLNKDGNGQYYGGGYFQGQYGNGGVMEQPPVWGQRTVITPAIAQGTALVGAFGQAATVYRKGGVRVESTNSHANDFTTNLVTVRAEERLALAVRRPSGLVKVTLTPAAA